MARITRCPHCLTPVYEGAVHCPHCEGEVSAQRRRKVLTRGAVVFVVVALCAWTATDSLLLLKHKKELEQDKRRASEVSLIVHDALSRPEKLEGARAIMAPIAEIAQKIDALPAERIEDLRVQDIGVYRIHSDQNGNTRRKRFSAHRFSWSAMAYRGGKWWTLRGIICMKGREPRCFRVDEVEPHGQTRPAVSVSSEPR